MVDDDDSTTQERRYLSNQSEGVTCWIEEVGRGYKEGLVCFDEERKQTGWET